MNKYQIAWEHIKTLKGSNFGYYGQFTQSFLAFEEDEKIIEEIVQKTIPKKIELFRIKKNMMGTILANVHVVQF